MSATVSGAVVGLVDGAGAAAGAGASATLSAGSAASAESVRDVSFPPQATSSAPTMATAVRERR